MIYIVDIDNTIFHTIGNDYVNSKPIKYRIEKLNKLYDEGHTIIYWTARGSSSGIDWHEFTINQLNLAGVKYTEIRSNKPSYDVWIDDKAIAANNYFIR